MTDTNAAVKELQGQQAGSASAGPQIYIRKRQGKLVAEEVTRDQHVPVADGYYKLRISGVTPVQDMDGLYGKSKVVRFEFTVNDPNSKEHKKRFSHLFPIQRFDSERDRWYSAITARTQTGKLFAAVHGRDVAEGESVDLTGMIGTDVMGMVQTVAKDVNGTIYQNSRIMKDGIRRVGSTDVPATPEPEPGSIASDLNASDDLDAAPVGSTATSQKSAFSDDLDDL